MMKNNKKRLWLGYWIIGSSGGLLGLAFRKAFYVNTQVALQVAYFYVFLGLIGIGIGLWILKSKI